MLPRIPLLCLVVFVLLVSSGCGEPQKPLFECVDMQKVVKHIHPHLTVLVDGKGETVPPEIGIVGRCMHPLHTHDDSGTIHVEYTRRQDFTLGHFFSVWENNPYKGMALTQVTLNGRLYRGDYRDIVLRDGQKITLHYSSGK